MRVIEIPREKTRTGARIEAEVCVRDANLVTSDDPLLRIGSIAVIAK